MDSFFCVDPLRYCRKPPPSGAMEIVQEMGMEGGTAIGVSQTTSGVPSVPKDDKKDEQVKREILDETEAEQDEELDNHKNLTGVECKTKGNECLKQKDYDGAIKWYTTAIDKDPTNHVFFSNRSAAYLQSGQFEKAVRDGVQTSILKPDWPKGYNRSGCALHALGDYKKAIMCLTVGMDKCFMGEDGCWLTGKASKLLLDPYKKAQECLRSDEMDAACLEKYGHSASTYHDLGLMYFHGHGGQKQNLKKSIKCVIFLQTHTLFNFTS